MQKEMPKLMSADFTPDLHLEVKWRGSEIKESVHEIITQYASLFILNIQCHACIYSLPFDRTIYM